MNENRLSLTEVFKNEKVVENINGNIFNDRENLDKVLQKVISFDTDVIIVDATIDNKPIVFENILYQLYHKDVYLLESRTFDKEKDRMLSAYLQVLDSDGNILDLNKLDDDVWSTKWDDLKTITTREESNSDKNNK